MGYGAWDSEADLTIPRALFASFRTYELLLPEAYIFGEEVRHFSRIDEQQLKSSIVPYLWRTCEGDMDPNPAFVDLYKSHFDALSPWTIGRYRMQDLEEGTVEKRLVEDSQYLSSAAPSYFPTMWPGESVRISISDLEV